MGIINVLDISVANLIAAGEVVERPANAVKELVENAIDAGADAVTVEIAKGGVSFLRVTDNGCGMSSEDAVVAVRRHATSKLHCAEDLSSIMTLGFRGEALAAITAVSEFRLMTKRREDAEGTLLSGEYGKVLSVSPAGCPDGTTIVCEKFFATTPARLKFLKSDSSEGAAVAGAVEKLAVSHPEIAFRFVSDGALKFSTSGDGNLKNAIYSVYGGAFAKNLVEVRGKSDGVEVCGYISSPDNLRGNRGMQMFFINDRCVRSKTLTASLEAAYRSYAPVGKFPSCVLNLKIPAALVDVNIHPAKLEVKFSNEKAVFDALYSAVRGALSVGIARPNLELAQIVEKTEKQDRLQNLFAAAEEQGGMSEEKPPKFEEPKTEPPKYDASETKSASPVAEAKTSVVESETPKREPVPQLRMTFDDDDLPVDVPILREKTNASPMKRFGADTDIHNFDLRQRLYASSVQSALQKEDPKPVIPQKSDANIPKAQAKPIPQYRIVGEVFASYVIVELEEKILLVDKHAAHERINFERLRANMKEQTPDVQMLLTPEYLSVSTEEAAICAEYREELSSCGFDFDVKDGEVSLRGIPFGFEKNEAKTLFLSLLTESVNGGAPISLGKQNAFEKALYQSSCKASVKAGRIYDEAHIRWICDNLLRYDCIKFCPHGRPVAFELSKKELDTRFGRT